MYMDAKQIEKTKQEVEHQIRLEVKKFETNMMKDITKMSSYLTALQTLIKTSRDNFKQRHDLVVLENEVSRTLQLLKNKLKLYVKRV